MSREKSYGVKRVGEGWRGKLSYGVAAAGKSYGLRQEPSFNLIRTRATLEPAIDVRLDRRSFRQGVFEEVMLELTSNTLVDAVSIEFVGAEAAPVKIEKLRGRTSVPVKLRFASGGKQQLVLRTRCACGGRVWLKEAVIEVDVEGSQSLGEFVTGGKKYRLVRRIGAGGSAEVYEALDEEGNRVALKLYYGSTASFVEEVGKIKVLTERLGRIPYVVSVIDAGVGVSEGAHRAYIAMDYYPTNLETLIRGGIEPKSLIKIMAKVAMILSYASALGVHHGDLKPRNILVREDRGFLYPAVGDWGGGCTPCYAAPEVYKRGVKELSEKGDVWSFGVILYEVLTRSRLFKDRSDYEGRIDEDVKVDLPHEPALESLVNRCLRKNPMERPSFREVLSELEAYIREALSTRDSKNELEMYVERVIRLSEAGRGDSVSYEEVASLLRQDGLVAVDPIRLVNYSTIIRYAFEAYTIVRGGGFKSAAPRLEQLINRILDLADEELRERLEKANCYSTVLNSLRIAREVLAHYPGVPEEAFERVIEELGICLSEIVDISSYLVTRLIVKPGRPI